MKRPFGTRPLVASAGLVMSAVIASAASIVGSAGPSAPPRAAAASRSRPPAAGQAPDAAGGFIQRWLLLEPIAVSGQLTDSAVQAVVGNAYFPNQLSVMPHAGDVVQVGDRSFAWHAFVTKDYNVNLFHFARALNKPTSNVLFWAVTVIDAPHDLSNVRLAIGSNAASVWWVNGEEVIGIYNDRQTVIDDGVSKRLTLKAGRNVIRAAIINAGGATDFCARVLDEDGRPVKTFTINLRAR